MSQKPDRREGSIGKKPSLTVGLLPIARFCSRVSPVKRERIDKLIVDRGLAHSRTRAQAMVMAGVVLVDEQLVNKPSQVFALDANIRLKGEGDPGSRYVGRGGLKLEAALQEFHVDVDELTCLDVGSSTGGFTDCLLQHGARRVVAVDVGHNQFEWRLRNDSRVEVREGVKFEDAAARTAWAAMTRRNRR